MFERDINGLKQARSHNAVFVLAMTNSGRIAGFATYSNTFHWVNTTVKGFISLTVDEYDWMTNPNRKTEVVTCADLYDRIEWTQSGFVLDGKRTSFKRKEQ